MGLDKKEEKTGLFCGWVAETCGSGHKVVCWTWLQFVITVSVYLKGFERIMLHIHTICADPDNMFVYQPVNMSVQKTSSL